MFVEGQFNIHFKWVFVIQISFLNTHRKKREKHCELYQRKYVYKTGMITMGMCMPYLPNYVTFFTLQMGKEKERDDTTSEGPLLES